MQSLEIHIQPSRRFIHSCRMHRTSRIFYTKDSIKFNSEYGPDIHNERLEILEFLYLVEKFLADSFQKFFDYNTKSESSGSESSEEENTEDSTQDTKSKKLYFYIFLFQSQMKKNKKLSSSIWIWWLLKNI